MRSDRRRHLWLVFMLAAALQMSLLSPGAAAAAFHGYSVGQETSGGAGFTGISVYRVDQRVIGQPADGCSIRYGGSPVYQTQWVIIAADAKKWREIGTGHQCNDTWRYWFWGYGLNGEFVEIGHTDGITNGQSHTFKIERVFEDTFNRYKFRIDGTLKGTMNSNATGVRVEAGLESTSNNAHVDRHNYTTLRYQKDNGAFFNWAGQDGSFVHDPLCGRWVAAVTWRAGERDVCT